MNENLSISHNAFAQLLKRRHKDDESLQQQELIDSLESVSIEQFKNHSKLRKSLRKALRANGIELALAASVGPLVAASDDVEETLPAGDAETNEQLLQQSAALSGNHPLPHEAIYRIKDPTARGGHKLIVSVPIAELTGEQASKHVCPLGNHYLLTFTCIIKINTRRFPLRVRPHPARKGVRDRGRGSPSRHVRRPACHQGGLQAHNRAQTSAARALSSTRAPYRRRRHVQQPVSRLGRQERASHDAARAVA